ncbi:glycosyltransferase family 2 protein [Leifsonia sp. NPDC056824]|uniref:glycosyltransferase family 2 protein n=1 Tax=Leifsonia sp. NPDC056824 TaxID=3345953 RepID=UPI0036D0F7BF
MPAAALSVALATYNGARYVGEQLASILGQVPAPAELVIADDGSADGTVEVALAEAERHGVRPTVLGPSGSAGVTANFERAVTATTQPLIALSDQDDRWHPGRVARLVAHFDADDALLLLHTDARLVDAEGVPLGRTLFESLEVGPHEFADEEEGRAFHAFLRRNLATGATVLFRRSLLDAALPFPREWVHDEWLAAIAAATGGVAVVREATIDYRQHGANEIGVAAPTLSRKVARVLEPRGSRNRDLATRFAILADRLAALGARVPAEYLDAARSKAAFEARRAALRPNRLLRVVPVARLALSGAYGRYASRGRADILRDLVQPS